MTLRIFQSLLLPIRKCWALNDGHVCQGNARQTCVWADHGFLYSSGIWQIHGKIGPWTQPDVTFRDGLWGHLKVPAPRGLSYAGEGNFRSSGDPCKVTKKEPSCSHVLENLLSFFVGHAFAGNVHFYGYLKKKTPNEVFSCTDVLHKFLDKFSCLQGQFGPKIRQNWCFLAKKTEYLSWKTQK